MILNLYVQLDFNEDQEELNLDKYQFTSQEKMIETLKKNYQQIKLYLDNTASKIFPDKYEIIDGELEKLCETIWKFNLCKNISGKQAMPAYLIQSEETSTNFYNLETMFKDILKQKNYFRIKKEPTKNLNILKDPQVYSIYPKNNPIQNYIMILENNQSYVLTMSKCSIKKIFLIGVELQEEENEKYLYYSIIKFKYTGQIQDVTIIEKKDNKNKSQMVEFKTQPQLEFQKKSEAYRMNYKNLKKSLFHSFTLNQNELENQLELI